ncbi:hypothetical protein TrLO_g2700 [Triparma laevis f. longispina]|uniref:Inositolphosphotransferase Aur1/Ipt1 domain-containing protein n=1 Tax=Triparma laevis f. longispina TaxID=1714387 RepID=A0A9W7DQU7_9STRA|nr:hypothetical protein TrLO_g2700 [Triparma laevis f. longispina]
MSEKGLSNVVTGNSVSSQNYTALRSSDSSLESLKACAQPLISNPICCFFFNEEKIINYLRKIGVPENYAIRLWSTVKQTAYIACGYIFYTICRIIAKQTTETSTAYDHAYDIVDFEEEYGFFTEKAWQEALVSCTFFPNNTVVDCVAVDKHSIGLIKSLNYFYTVAIWSVTPICAISAIQFAPRHYPVLAWWFCIASVFAAITFAAFPCAPPRLVTDLHIVDALSYFSDIDIYGEDPEQAVSSNPYAAFPSMHTGWSAICCMGTVYVTYMESEPGCKGWFRVLGAFLCTVWYPLLTIYTIVVTGNHFWSDALGGLLYVFVAFFIARKFFIDNGRMPKLEKVVYGDVYENSKHPEEEERERGGGGGKGVSEDDENVV